MTERDYYVDLLNKMENISNDLSKSLDYIYNLKSQFNNGLTINNIIYKEDEFKNFENDISSELDAVNNIIIPEIRYKIDSIEE